MGLRSKQARRRKRAKLRALGLLHERHNSKGAKNWSRDSEGKWAKDVTPKYATPPTPAAQSVHSHTGRSYGAAHYTRKHVHPLVGVFNVGTATVYAGSCDEIERSLKPWSLVLCCAGMSLAPVAQFNANAAARELMGKDLALDAGAAPYLALSWPDGSVPHISKEQWQKIALLVARAGGSVAVYCMGGHGRTGTALAILACLSGACPPEADPVAWVRKRYCSDAVESTAQITYIESITGRKVTEGGSWYWNDYDTVMYEASPRTGEVTKVTGNAGLATATVLTSTNGMTLTSGLGTATGAPTGDANRLAGKPVTSGHDKEGRPIFNAAGDVIGRSFDEIAAPTDPDADYSLDPWEEQGRELYGEQGSLWNTLRKWGGRK